LRSKSTAIGALRAWPLKTSVPLGRRRSDGATDSNRRDRGAYPVPVVPIALSGLWGSVFSRRFGRIWAPLLRSISARIGIAVGPAVRPEAVTPELLRERVLARCARASARASQ
jgi:1-acyl-sn-glycerol-3-phosphate acyltransferase